jgi:primosomal protein N' (replication factor Y)
VIVQTYSPHLPAILHARHHDFTGFSEQELEMRKVFSYPPYTHAALLTCKSPNQRMAEFTLETLHRRIVENAPEGLVVGDPAPSPLEKSHDQYRFQILLRAPRTSLITRHVQPILKGTTFPQDVVAVFDVDPVSLS